MTRNYLCLLIILTTSVVWLIPLPGYGQDTIDFQAQEPPALVIPGAVDSVSADQTDTLTQASSDSTSLLRQDPVFKLFTTLLEPLAYTVAIGAVLMILFTKRGK